MTDRIAELRALTEAATPGPWVGWDDPGEWMDAPVVAVDDGCPRGAGHVEIAEMGQGEAQGSHNARFIAAARNALPALLDVAEAGRRLADAVDTFRFAYQGDLWHVVIPDALAEMEDAARAWTAALDRLDGEETNR